MECQLPIGALVLVGQCGPQNESTRCLIASALVSGDRRCRVEAYARLAAEAWLEKEREILSEVISVQLIRGKARIWLSQVKRMELQRLLSGLCGVSPSLFHCAKVFE